MPVLINAKYPGPERRAGFDWPRVKPAAVANPSTACLHIGLVNNMADAALGGTEHQFLTLLEAAAGDMLVHVTLYGLPEVKRGPYGQRRLGSFYWNIEHLWEQDPEHYPDGLIVTGREPATPDLREEAYWPSFSRVLNWAHQHARSAVWSCLAAHAAVLALDGIERVRSPHKSFGIYACEQVVPHSLLSGAAAPLRVPHSRWNGLSMGELAANGYQVLTRTADGQVDTFVHQNGRLFVYFQGHLEYESTTLMREYRRDAARYFKGEMETYPLVPLNYFGARTERYLKEIEVKAKASREEKHFAEVSAVLSNAHIHNTWRASAALIYRNWLQHLFAQKRQGGTHLFGINGQRMPRVHAAHASKIAISSALHPESGAEFSAVNGTGNPESVSAGLANLSPEDKRRLAALQSSMADGPRSQGAEDSSGSANAARVAR